MKSKFFFFTILLLKLSFKTEAQNDITNVDREPCISLLEYNFIEDKLSNSKLLKGYKTTSNPVSLIWPVKASDLLKDCSFYQISAYVDQNKTTGVVQDYNCGTNTYDGHKGTDISTWPFNFHKMDNDFVQVIAAGDGIIIDKNDGEFDRNCSSNTLKANYVIVQHNDGSVALYWHMKNGSITTKKIGDSVLAGDYLGVVGSSGSAGGPHLHFEVWSGSTQSTAIDPFSGTCNILNASSYWANQKTYKETQIIKALVSNTDVVLPACPSTETSNEVSAFTLPVQGVGLAPGYAKFYIFLRDEVSGLTANMSILNPDQTVFATWTYSSTSNNGKKYTGWSKKLPTIAGKYSYVATYNGISCTSLFDIIDLSVSVNEVLTPINPSFSPNPSNGSFIFESKEFIGQTLDVYNTQGEKIMETLISNSQTQINIGNQIGVYYYALKKDGELKSSGKLVIQ